MSLITTQQFPGLQADIPGATFQGQQRGFQTREMQNRENLSLLEQQKAQQDMIKAQQDAERAATESTAALRSLGLSEDASQDTPDQARQRLIAMNPVDAKRIADAVGLVDDERKQEAAAFAYRAKQIADPAQQALMIEQRAEEIDARGGDSSNTRALLDTEFGEARNAELSSLEAISLTTMERAALGLKREAAQVKAAKGVKASEVQRSDILPDGTVQLVRKDGSIEIVSAGEADKTLIKQAREYGAEIQGLRAGERSEAKAASKVALKSFETLGKIRKNIVNLDRGIRLIDKGAGTGPIEKMFPSFKAASVELDQLRSELGLDVVGGVTFGALSEGELNLALDVAMPTGLDGPEMKQWLIDRREAQRKLASNLSEAAIFLGKPGNNIADFIEMKKAEQVATTEGVLPSGITEDDITVTMRDNNMTRQQVLDRLAQ